MNENVWPLILLGGGLLAFLLVVSFLSKNYSLNNFKNKTVGDGQHGTARWATPKEIHTTYHVVPFRPRRWRKGEDLPTVQGIILGSMGGRKRRAKRGVISQTTHKLLERLRRPTAGKKEKRKPKKKKTAISKIKNVMEDQRDVRALVDSDDIHCLMIGASGVGKTAFFLYPNLEYACACGMSYLALDTKGDLARNYGCIASKYYGYQVTVIDLRNPTRSDGFNFLTLMNHYMDIARKHPENLAARARAEKYAKILAKTIINPDGDAAQYGENAFFYDSAEGLLTAIVLLLAEFAPPKDGEPEKRHIVSAFKLVQDLLAVPKSRGKNGFQLLMDELPPEHMLSNERYCGDAILQKSVTVDCIEKKRKKNTGEAPMYYVQNNHPAIIDRVTFNKVQEELARRKTKTPGSAKSSITSTGKYSRYALTDVLICGNCGTRYRRVTWSRNGTKRSFGVAKLSLIHI